MFKILRKNPNNDNNLWRMRSTQIDQKSQYEQFCRVFREQIYGSWAEDHTECDNQFVIIHVYGSTQQHDKQ